MIIALLTWLFRKYAMPAISRYKGNRALKIIRNTVALAVLLTNHTSAFAQEQTTKYNVLHSGKVVGHLDLYQKRTGENLYLRMISEVKMRFIFSIRVNCNEESTFENGRLMSSRVLRNVNGKEKANRQTTAVGDAYQTLAEGKGGKVNQKDISANLMLLYTHEPADNAQVYSDNFQQFLKVKQAGNHVYRIDLPDGNYNYYTYTNGICSKVDIHHSLYTIQIQLA
jgi:ABC-type methionine transport system ATPase subunit